MRPLLETYASPIMFVGPAGNGQRVKLVNNALFVAQVGLAIDAVRLAGSLGIDEKAILAAAAARQRRQPRAGRRRPAAGRSTRSRFVWRT